jgi:signal transduction histidine kinase
LLFSVAGFLGLIVKSVYIVPDSNYYSFEKGPIYLPATLYFVSYMGMGIGLLIKKYRNTSSGMQRTQIGYLFLGTGGSVILGTAFNVVLPFFDKTTYGNLGPLTPLIAFSSISYAILKHRLMDINVVIKKSVTYSALLVMLLLPCYGLALLGQKVFFGRIEGAFSLLFLMLLTIAAFLFPRLKTRTEQTIEQVLFKGKYDYRDTLTQFSQDVVRIIHLDTLLDRTLRTLVGTLEVTKAAALLLNEAAGRYQSSATFGEEIQSGADLMLSMDDPVIRELTRHPRVLVTEELERQELDPKAVAVGGALRRVDFEACIPLSTRNRLIGIIVLGKKQDGGIYSDEDLKLLTTLGNEAAIAVENARLYEDLKQQQSAVRRAERLATLGTLTAGLAHEIRNPLVSVKTFLQLLPDRVHDEEFRTSFLQITSGEVERITHLLEQLLEFARPSDPEYRPEDLTKIIDQMATLARNEAFKKRVTLTTHYDDELPRVVIDAKQIKQVVQNLLNNAIQATPEEGRVHLEVRRFRGKGGGPRVQIEVSDTGKGIPEEDLEKIFTPFFTTRERGTGLGLAMSYRIIEDHAGTIEVKSQIAGGTTFTVTLPFDPLGDGEPPLA